MTKRTFRRFSRTFVVVMIVSAALCLVGCGGGGKPALRLRSLENGRLYSRQFDQAYFSRSSSGEYDIVLIDDGAPPEQQPTSKHDRSLQATLQVPLRQVVAIRVHWRPPHGVRADNPSATNAVVDWYVSGDALQDPQDRLHYQGSAFVRIRGDEKSARISLSNGSLSLLESSGALSDPVGESALSGSFSARRDETRVVAVTTPIRMESLARIRPAGSRQIPRSAGGQ